MSDQWGPTGSDDTGSDGDASPPPPPSGQTPVEPALTLETEGEVTRSGGIGGRVVAGVLGALLLVGGTVFAVTQLGSSGPESPEAAVSELLDAASDEDVLGLLAALDPGEREALEQPVQDLFAQLERLEVFDSSFQLDGVAGIDLAFDDVTFRTEPVRDDLARVYFTGGTVTTSIDSDEIPIGDFVADTLDRFGADISGFQESETNDIADSADTFIVAHNGSDGWRVSIGYTAAEAARLAAGQPLPDDPIEPIGSDSPEAAVEGMLRAAADLDLAGVIARLSPGELGPLQDYAGLFIDRAAAGLSSAGEDFDISIDSLDLSSETSGDRASVFVEGFGVTVTSDDMTISLTYADQCFTVEGDLDQLQLDESPFAEGPVCADDLDELMTGFFGFGRMTGAMGLGLDMPTLPTGEAAEVGITTAQVDGDWFVAPISTGLDALVGSLEALERSHLDAIVDSIEEMMTSFEEGFEESFEESFEGIGEPLESEFYEPGQLEAPATTALEGAVPSVDPAPFDTVPAGAIPETDEAALAEFVSLTADDETHAQCIMAELEFEDPFVRYELADAYAFDYEPSVETQEIYLGLLEYCRGA